MTTQWNIDRQPVPAAFRATLDQTSRVLRVNGLDPWLAATLLDDLFDRRFLWDSDCGGMRFAALGESRNVDFGDLNNAVRDAADALDLPARIASQLPLGLFVLGETDGRTGAFESELLETGRYCWTPQVLLLARGNDLLLYCADRGLRRESMLRLRQAAEKRAAWAPAGVCPELVETALDSRETWRVRIEQALAGIRQGDLEKLVVSRRRIFDSSREPLSPSASAWQAGRANGRTGFSISMNAGESAFIGATPETLLKVQDNTMTTHALAGTRERNATLEDFLASDKLAKEHSLVSDGLVTTLRPRIRSIRPGPLRVRRSGSVSHLETPLSGELRQGADPLQILSDLHPTAAIGGLPQEAAQQALLHIEPYSRGWFAAPVGWLAGNGNMHSAIAIRSLWVSAKRALALAGAGIVQGSVAEEEWAETDDKFDNMRAVIRGQRVGK